MPRRRELRQIDPGARDLRTFSATAVNLGLAVAQVSDGILSGSMALIVKAEANGIWLFPDDVKRHQGATGPECPSIRPWQLANCGPPGMIARARPAANALLHTVILQVALGVATLLFAVPVILGAAHQGVAMILFTVALYLVHALRRA